MPQTPITTTPGWIAYRWYIAVLLCLITTINYIDRIALAVAAPVMLGELSLSTAQYGVITSGFLFAYAIGQVATGPIIDRIGTKRAFGLAVVWWSIAGMLHAASRGFLSLLSFRVLLGLGEAANFPAALKAVAEWFPRAERTLAVGILTVGPGLGSVLAPPLVGGLILLGGWQLAFIVTGALGFLWLIAWRYLYDLPEKLPNLSDAERQHILAHRDVEQGEQPKVSWLQMAVRPQVLGLMASRFVSDGGFYFFVFFLPVYLASERGFDIRAIALFAWIPYLGADLGSLAGGWASKKLADRGMGLLAARKWVIWIGALLVPVAMPAAWVDSPMVAILLIALAMFFIQLKSAVHFTLPADLFPASEVGRVWGLFGAAGSFGGMFFTFLAGVLAEQNQYPLIFVLVSLVHILSAMLVSLSVRGAGRPAAD